MSNLNLDDPNVRLKPRTSILVTIVKAILILMGAGFLGLLLLVGLVLFMCSHH